MSFHPRYQLGYVAEFLLVSFAIRLVLVPYARHAVIVEIQPLALVVLVNST